MTRGGLTTLRAELAALDADGERLRSQPADDAERRSGLEVLARRRAELETRIASAVVVEPHTGPVDDVRFGAHVTVRPPGAADRRYQIVGVDEADAAARRIAFLAPLSRALLGQRVGDVVTVRTPGGEEDLEIMAVSYDA